RDGRSASRWRSRPCRSTHTSATRGCGWESSGREGSADRRDRASCKRSVNAIRHTAGMPHPSLALLVGIGLAAGLLSGVFGIGGGVVIIPALMYLAGFDQHLAT